MESLLYALITIFVYIAIYTLVDRVCKSFEYCARCKGTAEWLKDKDKNKENK